HVGDRVNSCNDSPCLPCPVKGPISVLLTIHRGTHKIGDQCVQLATAATRTVFAATMPRRPEGAVLAPGRKDKARDVLAVPGSGGPAPGPPCVGGLAPW